MTRRLLDSVVAKAVSRRLGPVLASHSQFGVGISAGVEHVATQTRVWHELHGTVLQLDCTNAFNSVDRLAVVEGISRFVPELLPYFSAGYLGETMPEMLAQLRVADGAATDSSYKISSVLGSSQQGDPLGPIYYSLAQTHVLHPERRSSNNSTSSSGNVEFTDSTSSDSATAAVAPHCAYLDDMNMFLPERVDSATIEEVRLVQSRLASVGLSLSLGKSLFVAKAGYTFSSSERELMHELGIPWKDASVAPSQQGFVTVGVPVGRRQFVQQHLHTKLFDAGLWQFAWHLRGMGESHLSAAFQLFHGSFIRRMGFLARNVDPCVGAAYFSGFDDLTAWTLENMLQLQDVATPPAIQQYIRLATAGETAVISPLKLSTLGPAGLTSLPLVTARLREHQGGLGLPRLGSTCVAAFVAQLQVTLGPSTVATATAAGLNGRPPDGLAHSPLMTAYAGALIELTTQSNFLEKLHKEHTATAVNWALNGAGDDQAAYEAATADPLVFQTARDTTLAEGDSTPTTFLVEPLAELSVATREVSKMKRVQKRLTDMLNDRALAELRQLIIDAGDAGKKWAAQLRSQSAPYAKAWLQPTAAVSPLPVMHTATMLLVTLFIDCWGIKGGGCPYRGCGAPHASAVHAVGCTRQPDRGVNATHTAQKRTFQNILRKHHISDISNENSAPFTDPTRELRMDTLLPPGSLRNCSDQRLQTLGVLLDTSVVTPTAQSYLSPQHENAATVDGYAATAAEKRKARHYGHFYCRGRWRLVTMAQESFGRLGREGAAFIEELATHSARCKGGTVAQVARRRSRILADIRTELSVSLARELAERLNAYARSSRLQVNPVSALLTPITCT